MAQHFRPWRKSSRLRWKHDIKQRKPPPRRPGGVSLVPAAPHSPAHHLSDRRRRACVARVPFNVTRGRRHASVSGLHGRSISGAERAHTAYQRSGARSPSGVKVTWSSSQQTTQQSKAGDVYFSSFFFNCLSSDTHRIYFKGLCELLENSYLKKKKLSCRVWNW